MKISVLIPSFRRSESLDGLIEDLSKQQSLNQNLMEIVVVIDSPEPEYLKLYESVLSKYKDINIKKIINPKNSGIEYTRNTAIKNATGDFIVFLDDDMRIKNNFIASYIEFFTKYPEGMIVGEILSKKPLTLFESYIYSSKTYFSFTGLEDDTKIGHHSFFCGNFGGPTKTIAQFGFESVPPLPNGQLNYGYDDLILSHKLNKIGVSFYFNGKSKALHDDGFNPKNYLNKKYLAGVSGFTLVKKYPELDYAVHYNKWLLKLPYLGKPNQVLVKIMMILGDISYRVAKIGIFYKAILAYYYFSGMLYASKLSKG